MTAPEISRLYRELLRIRAEDGGPGIASCPPEALLTLVPYLQVGVTHPPTHLLPTHPPFPSTFSPPTHPPTHPLPRPTSKPGPTSTSSGKPPKKSRKEEEEEEET